MDENVHIREGINEAPGLYWWWPIPTIPGIMGCRLGGASRDQIRV
jgi:hypothetical protein